MTTTDPTTTNDTPSESETDLTAQLLEALQRIEAKLDAIFDVLAADEDEEIQLTLDDKDAKREGEQGKGLG